MRQPKELIERARRLRQADTRAERRAWVLLRDRRMFGLKFRRQVPIETFIADFYCHELRLIIELDGGCHSHEEKFRKDTNRDRILKNKGYQILRFRNETILNGERLFIESIRTIMEDTGTR
jgi:very-short-patch-repair endonuclease